jgi:UDP-N-acetylglucosamine--dolichyl-phosphate N-acetylglucosaminephosphotransferase
MWASVVISILAFVCTFKCIPNISTPLSGKDLAKPNCVKIPEGLGIISGGITVVGWVVLGLPSHLLFPLTAALLLGFMDDVIDIPWRMKLLLPAIASLSMKSDHTTIEVNGVFIHANISYTWFAALVCVYCFNTVNILAGINGIEVGQSIVIAITFIFVNSYTISMMLPFIASSLALLYYNWYPARVFVGDSFTLFAGMLFGVAGLYHGLHSALFWMLLPQTLNFCYSLPQLLKFEPCPRHRIPKYNPETNRLYPSHYNGKMNKTVLNLILKITGPIPEKKLASIVIFLQILTCSFAYYLHPTPTLPYRA